MLRFAVLVDAILLLQRRRNAKDVKGRRQLEDAKRWIWREDTHWPFSFRNICEALGLDADYLQRGLQRWQTDRAPSRLIGRPRPDTGRWPYHSAG